MSVIEYTSGESEPDLVRIIRRFLNALSWREQTYIREVDVTYGSPLRAGTRIPDNFTVPTFDERELPDPTDDKARIALGFYREGFVLEHINRAYSFLSFFKVLNVRFQKGADQTGWINTYHTALKAADSVARLQEIQQLEPDVGAYLYASGRCAVAHAFNTPLVNPDDIEDQQRLSKDWPVIRSLAALLIQREWGIAAPPGGAAV